MHRYIAETQLQEVEVFEAHPIKNSVMEIEEYTANQKFFIIETVLTFFIRRIL